MDRNELYYTIKTKSTVLIDFFFFEGRCTVVLIDFAYFFNPIKPQSSAKLYARN